MKIFTWHISWLPHHRLREILIYGHVSLQKFNSALTSLSMPWLFQGQTFIATFFAIFYHRFHQVFSPRNTSETIFAFLPLTLFFVSKSLKGSFDVHLKIGLDRLHQSIRKIKQNWISFILLYRPRPCPGKTAEKVYAQRGRQHRIHPQYINQWFIFFR